jgi:hypothetical protein
MPDIVASRGAMHKPPMRPLPAARNVLMYGKGEVRMAYTVLYEPSDPYTTTLIESILAEHGIEHRIVERGLSSTVFGMPAHSGFPTAPVEVQVEERQLEAAKRLLCEHDIVCDLSERMRARGYESFALPLLEGASRDLERLASYLRVNNRTTVAAIFDDIACHAEGEKLLVRLFFYVLGDEESPTPRRLAHFLNEHPPAELRRSIELRWAELTPEKRRSLAALLGALPSVRPEPLLVEFLRDADEGLREAAIEALFVLTSEDFGFEPDASEDERLRAVERWEKWARGAGRNG